MVKGQTLSEDLRLFKVIPTPPPDTPTANLQLPRFRLWLAPMKNVTLYACLSYKALNVPSPTSHPHSCAQRCPHHRPARSVQANRHVPSPLSAEDKFIFLNRDKQTREGRETGTEDLKRGQLNFRTQKFSDFGKELAPLRHLRRAGVAIAIKCSISAAKRLDVYAKGGE